MAAPVPRQKHHRLTAESAEAEFVRGIAERALDPPPFDIGEPVDAIKPAAADNADNPAGHGICLRDNPAELRCPVEWVERSETHQIRPETARGLWIWALLRSAHPT